MPSRSRVDGSGVVDVTVRVLEPKGPEKPYVPRCVIGVEASINVTDEKGQPPKKLVCTSYSEAGLVMVTNEITQPAEAIAPPTDSLRNDEIDVVVVRSDGTSNDQANVEGVVGPVKRDASNV